MGKAIVIIFAAVSLILVPVSLLYVADTNVIPADYTLEFQGRFYDAKIGGESGFGFFKFLTPDTSIFNPDAWNQAFPDEPIIGLQTGTFMMILWYVGMGMIVVGIIVAFFRLKLSSLFFILAFVADGLQPVIWFLGMRAEGLPANIRFFPIPISALFLLVTIIIALTSKKKESYYYSPGYSYGYGRR
ncbi:MAG: hypothetical protein FK732_08565 [Asgard group archaeon]|nr:hypothetical protein [Asgard group archaeon]